MGVFGNSFQLRFLRSDFKVIFKNLNFMVKNFEFKSISSKPQKAKVAQQNN